MSRRGKHSNPIAAPIKGLIEQDGRGEWRRRSGRHVRRKADLVEGGGGDGRSDGRGLAGREVNRVCGRVSTCRPPAPRAWCVLEADRAPSPCTPRRRKPELPARAPRLRPSGRAWPARTAPPRCRRKLPGCHGLPLCRSCPSLSARRQTRWRCRRRERGQAVERGWHRRRPGWSRAR